MPHFILALFVSLSIFFWSFWISFGATIEELEEALSNYGISYQANSYIENPVTIDLGPLETLLEENFSDIPLEYSWNIDGKETLNEKKIETTFDTPWEKSIQLNIFVTEDEEKKLVFESDLRIFIYETTLGLLVSSDVEKNEVDDFISVAQEQWVYVKRLGAYSEETLSWDEILQNIESYHVSFPKHSDYTTIWWEKEFIFSALNSLSLAHNRQSSQELLNFVLVSSYNTELLHRYILNNISGKSFIQTAFILDDAIKYQILKYPESIDALWSSLTQNSYSYTPVSTSTPIPPYLFISKFINTLANDGMHVSDIYIILLLPLFFTIVAFTRHMIGFGSIWNVIPIFLSLLCIKLWVLVTFWVCIVVVICDIFLGKFLNRYTLLYTPKVALMTTLNLFILMWIYVIARNYWVAFWVESVLYFVMFFVVSEKLVTVITSKEFREYEKNMYGSVFIALICYGIYFVDPLRVFLMSYPEILIVLVPLNFFIGRFTGLRVTEYFRFREVLNTIEE